MATRIFSGWRFHRIGNEATGETPSAAGATAGNRLSDQRTDGQARPRLRLPENSVRSSLYKAYQKANARILPHSAAGRRRQTDVERKQAWTAWAQEDHLPHEQRNIALDRLRAWRRSVPRPTSIDLSNLGLKTTPPYLPTEITVNLDNNPLLTLNAWREWATAPDLSEEEAAGRHLALRAVDQWIDADPKPAELVLSGLGLRSLPRLFLR